LRSSALDDAANIITRALAIVEMSWRAVRLR
jgi:hypothetical protein